MGKIDKHFTRQVTTLESVARCTEAAVLMRERRIGSVAVRDGGRIVGLVTERDLVVHVMAAGGTADLTLGVVVRRDLPGVEPHSSAEACAGLMRDHNTRHLLVRERGQVIGIVSMRDVIQQMLDEKQTLVDQLQDYICRS
jgi:CBS domain-containing protein